MAQLAGLIAERTKNGDTLLLEGEIGAGKSAFARGFIRAKLGRLEDVPSPTFTIVQVYNSDGGEIWHCDLYRLTHPDEALELGLDEAFETAICLVEWPDRLGEEQPETALRLSFAARETHHDVSISGADEWADRLKGLDAKA
ncbi:tRNA threonylcarbamoyladenosine biosynthesis protein TsaE [Yoonia litorea]|uniref:tRNA threonylcarbamoyladenosine biosynthesis protein TsaE n=2 Tax=Yoonia litorea TaxID=1123755 RepID=A0A1I6MW28_9RHOB|nr:tRNA threonylcarbamoyladenosine biosynthesis protein TsaE [Yoonia litorea]